MHLSPWAAVGIAAVAFLSAAVILFWPRLFRRREADPSHRRGQHGWILLASFAFAAVAPAQAPRSDRGTLAWPRSARRRRARRDPGRPDG
jgi:hypothetical protein